MTIEIIRDALAWCTVINWVLLLWWLLFFIMAHDWMYRIHSKWFNLSVDKFDAIHYAGMALFKTGRRNAKDCNRLITLSGLLT